MSSTSREIQRIVAFSKLCEEHQVTPSQVAESVQFLEKIGCAVSLPVLVADPEAEEAETVFARLSSPEQVEKEEEQAEQEEQAPAAKVSKLSPERRKAAASGTKKSWEEARKYAKQHGIAVSDARTYLAQQKNR